MDAFLGSWKIQLERNEGPLKEMITSMEIDAQFVEMFAKAVYTLMVEDVGGGQYKYTITMEGSPDKHVAGPFKLGETFEFYDIYCKRTEQITITAEGGKTKEVTVIKENPAIKWTVCRYMEGGDMVADTETKGFKVKSYLAKV